MRHFLTAVFLGLGLIVAMPALAQPAMTATEEADFQLAERAYSIFARSSYAGIQPLLPNLRAALDNAPASQPSIEIGDDYIIVRASSETQAIVLMTLASAVAPDDGRERSVVTRPTTYPLIALLLAAEAVERGRYEEALSYTSRGLSIQPDDASLVLEHSIALMALDRDAEALEMIDAALASGSVVVTDFEAPLLRRRGSLLIELRRLPEARAALERSLEIEPNHPTTLNELAIIDASEAGDEIGDFRIIRPGEADEDR
jgi:tetratricopeptide (TPR) repeat protein